MYSFKYWGDSENEEEWLVNHDGKVIVFPSFKFASALLPILTSGIARRVTIEKYNGELETAPLSREAEIARALEQNDRRR